MGFSIIRDIEARPLLQGEIPGGLLGEPGHASAQTYMNITNVLVVDDDVAICRIVRRMPSNERCNVQMSQSVASAHEAIEQKPFDAYVLDYKLPDVSGLDVAEWIRSKQDAAPSFLCRVMTHIPSR